MKEPTRDRIVNEAQRMGYRPNLNAVNLVTGKTRTVWFLIPSLHEQERIPAEQTSVELAKGGYDTLLAIHHHDPLVFDRWWQRLEQGAADGVVVIPGLPGLSLERCQVLVDRGFPLVFVDRSIEGVKAPLVTSDNAKGAADLVAALLADGVDRVVFDLEPHNVVMKDRRRGAIQALEEAGVPYQGIRSGELEDWLKKHQGGRLGLLANSASEAKGWWESLEGRWRGKGLCFACFDRWIGEPHPADMAVCAVQDFKAMGQKAGQILTRWLTSGKAPVKKVTRVALEDVITVRRRWD